MLKHIKRIKKYLGYSQKKSDLGVERNYLLEIPQRTLNLIEWQHRGKKIEPPRQQIEPRHGKMCLRGKFGHFEILWFSYRSLYEE